MVYSNCYIPYNTCCIVCNTCCILCCMVYNTCCILCSTCCILNQKNWIYSKTTGHNWKILFDYYFLNQTRIFETINSQHINNLVKLGQIWGYTGAAYYTAGAAWYAAGVAYYAAGAVWYAAGVWVPYFLYCLIWFKILSIDLCEDMSFGHYTEYEGILTIGKLAWLVRVLPCVVLLKLIKF